MIESERLILRQWKDSDRQLFFELNASELTMRYFPKTLSKEESNSIIDNATKLINEKGFGWFATEIRKTNEFIGFIGLNNPNYETHFTPCTEIGWRLHPKFWGNGYATEGAKALLNFAFNKLKLKEVVSFTSIHNLPSIKVMKRIGMSRDFDGNFNHPKLDNEYKLALHVLYRLNSKDFFKSKL